MTIKESPHKRVRSDEIWTFTNRFKTYRINPSLAQIVKNEPHSVKNMLEEKIDGNLRVKNFNTRVLQDRVEHIVRYREDKSTGPGTSELKIAYAQRSLEEIMFNERSPISLRKMSGEKLVLITPVLGNSF